MSRDQVGSGPILGRGTKLIGSLIGAGTEAYAHRKAKKEQENAPKNAPQVGQQSTGVHEEQVDDEDWALDEASGELSAEKGPEAHVSLLDTPGLSTPTTSMKPLQFPVVLPQRRPQTKSRGFVRAYAPLLGECKGIDERMFLRLLDEFHEKTQASQYLQAVNIAAGVVGMVPSVVAMAVSTGMGIAARGGTEVQSRYRTNTYLDQANTLFFNPRNLHCVIMTFKPESSHQIVEVDMNATNDTLMKSINNESKMGKMKGSSGTTKSEFAIPTAAPLIYPALDAAAFAASEDGKPLTAQKQNALKRSSVFIKDYIDRRAQAEYTGTAGPDSKLNIPGATDSQKFASRYADPNHPVNSGSIVALLTGGAVDPRKKFLGKRAEMHAKVKGQELTEQDRQNVAMGRAGPNTRPGVMSAMRKVLKEDVLYMLIAEIPGPMEMAEYARMQQEARK